jgi:hypothetical protein
MICKKCQEEGKTSTVCEGGTSVTSLGYAPRYDEKGVYHYHDDNCRITSYRCSRNHYYNKIPAKTVTGRERPTVFAIL